MSCAASDTSTLECVEVVAVPKGAGEVQVAMVGWTVMGEAREALVEMVVETAASTNRQHRDGRSERTQ